MKRKIVWGSAFLGLAFLCWSASHGRPAPGGQADGFGKARSRSIVGTVQVAGGSVQFDFQYMARSYRRVPPISMKGTVDNNGQARFSFKFTRTEGFTGALRFGDNQGQVETVTFTGPLNIRGGSLELTLSSPRAVPLNGYDVKTIRFSGAWEGAGESGDPGDGIPDPQEDPDEGRPAATPFQYGSNPFKTPPNVDYRKPAEIRRPEQGNAGSLSFAVFGDWGMKTNVHRLVSDGLDTYQQDLRESGDELDAIFMAGDNFYPWGIESLEDERWESLWGKAFRRLGVPCYVALGNHDYKRDLRNLALPRAQLQVAKSGTPGFENWKAADENGPAIGIWYDQWFTSKDFAIQLVVIDTNLIVLRPLRPFKRWGAQLFWLDERLGAPPPGGEQEGRTVVRLVMGHHLLKAFARQQRETAYLDGETGRVGPRGTTLEEIIQAKADAYICGHAHMVEYTNIAGNKVKPASGPIHGKKRTLRKKAVLQILSGSAAEVRQYSTWASSIYYTARLPGFTHLVFNKRNGRPRLYVHFVDCRSHNKPKVIYSLSIPSEISVAEAFDDEPLPPFPRRAGVEMQARAADFYQRIKSRRSVRHFAATPVPRAVIEDCIRAAGTAPNGANKQPWHFVAVSDPGIKRAIREAAEEEERAFYEGRASDEWLAALAPLGTDSQKPFLEVAPYLLVVFQQVYGLDPRGARVKHYYVGESVGIATGFLIAALHHAGLATLTHTPSPMGFLAKVLGRPANERAVMIVVAGYPAADARVPKIGKKPLEEIASFLGDDPL